MTTEVARVDEQALGRLDPASREAAVVGFLADARAALAQAVAVTNSVDSAHAVRQGKAQVMTAEVATRTLGLSKEVREEAAEMVRRSEWALHRAIRRGQAEGTIMRHGDNTHARDLGSTQDWPVKAAVTEFASYDELYGGGATNGLTDLASEPEQFEQALADAKAEGNLSRANVVRKLRGEPNPELTLRKPHGPG